MDDEALPQDIPACHRLIVELRAELSQMRRELAVHEENQRQEFARRYGPGVTPQSLLSVGQRMNRPPSDDDKRAIDAELAAEDAMRSRGGRRKKK